MTQQDDHQHGVLLDRRPTDELAQQWTELLGGTVDDLGVTARLVVGDHGVQRRWVDVDLRLEHQKAAQPFEAVVGAATCERAVPERDDVAPCDELDELGVGVAAEQSIDRDEPVVDLVAHHCIGHR